MKLNCKLTPFSCSRGTNVELVPHVLGRLGECWDTSKVRCTLETRGNALFSRKIGSVPASDHFLSGKMLSRWHSLIFLEKTQVSFPPFTKCMGNFPVPISTHHTDFPSFVFVVASLWRGGVRKERSGLYADLLYPPLNDFIILCRMRRGDSREDVKSFTCFRLLYLNVRWGI